MQHAAITPKFRGIMSNLSIELPDFDSKDGVTLETLTAYVEKRGSKNVEEFVNICLADALGFGPKRSTQFLQLSQLRDSLKT